MNITTPNIPDRRHTDCLKWDLMTMIGGTEEDIPLWIADMDFAIAPPVIEAVQRRLTHPVLGYTFQPPAYREAINGWYRRRHGTAFDAEMILPCLNVLGAMQLIVNRWIRPGDSVMMFTPVYPQFYGILKTAGAQLLSYPLDGCEPIDWKRAEELIGKSRAVLLCNPHNPLARVWTREECAEIARICARYDVLLLSDEVHGDMAMFGNRYSCMASFPEVRERVVVFTSAAKTFNLAGLGGAALLIPGSPLRKEIHSLLEQYCQCEINALSAAGIQSAYEQGDTWLDETRAYLEDNVSLVLAAIQDTMPKLKCQHQGTFLMWIDWRGLERPDLDIARLMKEKVHILLDNGNRYGAGGEGYIRANIACGRDLLQRGADGFQRLYSDIEKGKY